MPVTTLSSREFNQRTSDAKRAAIDGPVVITDRGRPSHVLLSFDEYQKLSRTGPSIADLLAMPGAADIEFDPPKMNLVLKPVDFD